MGAASNAYIPCVQPLHHGRQRGHCQAYSTITGRVLS